ncbi:MAG TPA: triose-phosphate isomerase [Dongiaceae bacterium]|nr:triose-phosphate isomerase [Dongiaceae bacterium]
MSAPFWIGAGWKMNKTREEALGYARALRRSSFWRDPAVRSFVLPPFTVLGDVARALAGTGILVGAQTMHWAESGAYTGEVSAAMIRDCGAGLVELGHSERRRLFGESDEEINRKVRAAAGHGLRALVCVGESEADRRFGVARETVARQVKIALHGLDRAALDRVLIAYEPAWAIGEGGTAATPDYADRMHGEIRRAVAAAAELPGSVPILYGGSVTLDNCLGFAAAPGIDGLFIGRAAWDAAGFLAIVEAVRSAGRGRGPNAAEGPGRREPPHRPDS